MARRQLRARVNGLAGWSVVVAFVLIGVALMATVWATRASVLEASNALRGGQAMMVTHAVRADLAQLDGLPTAADLEAIVAEHGDSGLRYLAVLAPRGAVTAGAAAGDLRGDPEMEPFPNPRSVRMVGGRVRFVMRLFGPPPHMMPAPGMPRPRHMMNWPVVIEVEPVQANSLREAAGLSLGIGAIATASLLAVAIVLVRRESRRQADARDRERQRRLASLGEMSAVLAHEIRNPLASLKGNAQLLAQLLPEGDKPRAKADRVVEEAVRLEKLSADLLRFVRTSELVRTPVDPGALVRAAAEEPSLHGAHQAAEAEAALSVRCDAAPARWSLDADRFREVIVNLVDNALAAGPPVEVTVSEVRGSLRVDVADRGSGVPAEDRERIFEPFVTGKTQGTGLGLAVARRVVEAHGGTLELLEHPGGGALFRVEIPKA